MRLEDLRFPRRFEGMDVDTLKVQVVFVNITGQLVSVVYNSLDDLENSNHFNLRDLGGPMAGSLNNQLCIRFETNAAANILSN